MKSVAFSLLAFVALGAPLAHAQQVTESFEDAFPATGWDHQNRSAPVGPTPWAKYLQQAVLAHGGTHFAMSDYLAAGNGGTISDWLITPQVTIVNGVSLRFWTRSTGEGLFADRMQVRMSTAGASVDVGTTAASVGDFTTLLVDINDTLSPTGYPTVYTEYVLTVTGVAVPTTGRFAFRYFVSSAGTNGAAVVLDDVEITSLCGNSSIDAGETCDDGNTVTEECPYGQASCTVCTDTCQTAAGETDVCGDGTEDSVETCDDGNTDTERCAYGEASCTVCSGTCQTAAGETDVCGDGIEDAGFEDCDDGNAVDGDDCDSNCSVTACGNGIVTDGEACDDGNSADGDGCTSGCTEEVNDNDNDADGVVDDVDNCPSSFNPDQSDQDDDDVGDTCDRPPSGGGRGAGCAVVVSAGRGARGGVLVMLGLIGLDLVRRRRRARAIR